MKKSQPFFAFVVLCLVWILFSFSVNSFAASEPAIEIEEKIDNIARHTVEVLRTLRASARRGGLGERVVKEDILGKYIPRIASLKKEVTATLSSKEAEDAAYAEISDSVHDFREEKKAGIIILMRILNDRSGNKEKFPVIESVRVDTSVY
jgi:hypothetical protein